MGVLVRHFYPRHANQGLAIFRRSDEQTVPSSSTTLVYSPSSGAWSDAAFGAQSCAQSAESSVSSGSYVGFSFTGTSLTVNIIKDVDGAPYNVTVDGTVHSYDSYADSQQCTSDYQVSDLAAREHQVVVTHNGNSSLLANGRSQLRFVSFQYIPSTNTDPLPSSSPPVAAIVGGVLGGLAFLILICGLVWWRHKRKRFSSGEYPTKEEPVPQPYGASANPVPYTLSNSETQTQSNQSNTALLPIRRTKGDDNNNRYARRSPWHSSSSNPNTSHQNLGSDPNANHVPWGEGSSQSIGDSPPPSTRLTSYPAFSATEMSSNPSSSSQDVSRRRRQRHYAAPSAAGESVIIDDPNYIPPPSYSPPPTNHPHPRIQQSIQQAMGMPEKAVYDGADRDGVSASGLRTHELALPPAQFSSADIDIIARRVVDLMRSPAGSTGASNANHRGLDSSEAQDPQVQQAIRALLSQQDDLYLNSTHRNDLDDKQKH